MSQPTPSDSGTPAAGAWKINSICLGLLALLLLLVFWPGLNYPFLRDWDDGNFVMFNSNLAFTLENFRLYALEPFQDLYTPLPMYSFMLDRALFGLEPLGFRLHNLLLHFTAAAFLFLMIRQLGARAWLALGAALLWAANPQKVESVIWITERKDVLCGAFAFASLWFFLRSVSRRRVPWIAGILAVLAIFAKPAAISLPGVMIVGLICLRGKRLSVREYWRILRLPVLLSLGAVVWSSLVTAKTNPGVMETNLLIPLHNMFWYPLTALIPYETNPIYPEIRGWSELALPAAGGIALLGIYVLAARKLGMPWRRIVCLLLIVGGFSVPVLGMLQYTTFHYCDRYNYLVSGDISVAYSFTPFVALALDANPDLKVVWPEEGLGFGIDGCFIPVNAPHAKNANIFLQYMLRPEVAATCAEWQYYCCPNEAAKAYLSEAYLNNPVFNGIFDRLDDAEYVRNLSSEDEQKFQDIWTKFKLSMQ